MLVKQLYLRPILTSLLFYFIRPVISYDNAEVIADNFHSQNGADYLRFTKRASQTAGIEKRKFAGEKCHGYEGAEGRCLSLESCVLKPLLMDYIKYQDYLCITKQKKVGVCCPNSIDVSTVYEERNKEKIIHNIKKGKVFRRRRNAIANDPPKNIKTEVNTCGRNGQLLSEDIKTGSSWPWIASLKIANSMSHFCGATLITRYHLLSAAHCFVLEGGNAKKESVIVRLGEYDFKDANGTKFSDHKVAAIIPHEDYDYFNYEHDIAILLLEKPAEFSIYIQPICMPKVEVYNNRKAIVVGWGHVKTGGPGSEILREIEVPVWQHASCEDSISQTIFTTNVCAGDKDGKKDSCQNDSGGPLMMRRKTGQQSRWEIAGIVSWGVKCAQKGRPGVYTQVNKYLDWIYDKLSDS